MIGPCNPTLLGRWCGRHGCRWFGRSQLDRLFVCVFARRFSRGRVKSTARFCGFLLCRGSEVSRCLSVFNAFTISRQKVICWAIPILRVGFNGTHQACSLNACSLEICFGQKIPLMQPYIKTTSSSRISFILSDCISNTAAAPSGWWISVSQSSTRLTAIASFSTVSCVHHELYPIFMAQCKAPTSHVLFCRIFRHICHGISTLRERYSTTFDQAVQGGTGEDW